MSLAAARYLLAHDQHDTPADLVQERLPATLVRALYLTRGASLSSLTTRFQVSRRITQLARGDDIALREPLSPPSRISGGRLTERYPHRTRPATELGGQIDRMKVGAGPTRSV
ncbi:hypothetical protein ACPZ19_12035 [Amycolatopsis lurida]